MRPKSVPCSNPGTAPRVTPPASDLSPANPPTRHPAISLPAISIANHPHKRLHLHHIPLPRPMPTDTKLLNKISSVSISKKAPAESWEDEASDSEPEPAFTAAQKSASSTPVYEDSGYVPSGPSNALYRPDITRDSSFSSTTVEVGSPAPSLRGGASPVIGEKERPAKTDAVARRMISAALGVRTKSTKEQREFDAALREKEKKKRDEER